jgi:predicted dehydrogenase
MTSPSAPLIRVVLVGVGNRGLWPLRECTREAGWEVVGLVDISEAHLEAARKTTGLGAGACFRELAPALDALRPEAVILCTPTVTHSPFCKEAIRRGIPVLTEKGMATCWEEAADLVAFAAERRAVLAVAQNYRYDGVSALVRAALGRQAGPGVPVLEGVFLIDYVQHRVRPRPGTLTYPFASVWDMSCHHFDNLLDWLGPVAEVTAHAYRAPWSPYEHPANTSAFLRFRCGVSVNYCHTHDAARGSLRVALHGVNGAFCVTDDGAEFSERPDTNFGVRPVTRFAVEPVRSERAMLADFRAYAAEGREPGISARHNLETMALCELVVRSATLHRTVRREELGS